MVNAEEIRRVVKFMEENPENWDQRQWAAIPSDPDYRALPGMTRHLEGELCVATAAAACGTTMCFAGFTASINGYTPVFRQGVAISSEVMHPVTGEVLPTSAVAKELLGLTKDQADMLFHDTSRHPLGDYKKKITRVTGVRFDD